MVHIVYCNKEEIDSIIDGKKTMVIRGADGRKIPHSRVFIDDELYFMDKKDKTIYAKARVLEVENYVKLNSEEIDEIIEKNNSKLLLTDSEKKKWHKRCLCLVEFSELEKIEPLEITMKTTMDNWKILNDIREALNI